MSKDNLAIFCEKCGQPLEPNWSKCSACEWPVKSPGLVCPNPICQRPIEDHWELCPVCATKLPCSEIIHTNELSSGKKENLHNERRTDDLFSGAHLDLSVGEILTDNYKVLRKLGVGGFAAVYKVEDISLNRQKALKVVVTREDKAQHITELFWHEYSILRKKINNTDHLIETEPPCCCKYKGLSLILLPMELADGGALRQWLFHNRDVEKRMKTALKFFKQACLGIKAIHCADLVHLNIKPENILLVGEKAKIVVFGIGRYGASQFTNNPDQLLRQGIGTPQYMSPEQFHVARQKEVGPASDIYSLGIVLFELLDGDLPFDGTPIELRDKHLNIQPPQLTGRLGKWWPIVNKCLAKQPEDRYPNIDLLIADIEACQEDG